MTDLFECPTDHKHDLTTTCYSAHHCRCTSCRAAASLIRTTRKRLEAYGRLGPLVVPTAPVRAHIRRLYDAGVPVQVMAELSGVAASTANLVLFGTSSRSPGTTMLAKTANRLLSIDFESATQLPTVIVSSTPTIRRLQALMCVGWSQPRIAARVGMTQQGLSRLMLMSTTTTKRMHDLVADVYEQMWNVHPATDTLAQKISVTVAKNVASSRRWLPPMAWDDIDNDVTPPVPEPDDDYVDEVLIEIAMSGENVRLTLREREEALTRLHGRNLSDTAIADLLHITGRTVLRIRQRLGLPAAVGADKQPLAA
jgi:transcriptional regulator with XRE-family HTH domain